MRIWGWDDVVRERSAARMRRYWDERARRNAVWYVDTSTDFDNPDMDAFLLTGQRIIDQALRDPGVPVSPRRRERAVEIGSGVGRICLALADDFDEVVGVDVSEEMVRQARELVDKPGVRFVVGDGARLPGVPDGTVDFVISFTVFQHMPDPDLIKGYLSEAARVLRSGGVLAFQWNNLPGHRWWRIRRAWLATLHRLHLYSERYERSAPEFMGSRVPFRTIERTLASDGLEVCGTADLGTLFAWCWARKP